MAGLCECRVQGSPSGSKWEGKNCRGRAVGGLLCTYPHYDTLYLVLPPRCPQQPYSVALPQILRAKEFSVYGVMAPSRYDDGRSHARKPECRVPTGDAARGRRRCRGGSH